MDDHSTKIEVDINDVFHTIAFSEDEISQEAYEEGLIKGKEDGKIDGYHLGFHQGFNLGTEIGFYKELVAFLEEKNYNEKTEALLRKLKTSLVQFPTNVLNEDILREISNIRAHIRKLNYNLNLNIPFPTSSENSF